MQHTLIEGSMTKLLLNGQPVDFLLDPQTPLLWALRDTANLTGTKYGCGKGFCGACTVMVDKVAVRSCQVPLEAVAGAEVVTIEGLAADSNHPVQQAWLQVQVPQCGYCMPGMIMAAAALLEDRPDPTVADIEEQMTNLCRCGAYARIRHAVLRAVALKALSSRGSTEIPAADTEN